MADANTAYQNLVKNAKETAALTTVEELLNWDQRTLMPRNAAGYRAEQITLLSGLIHDKVTDPRRGDWLRCVLDDPNLDPSSDRAANARVLLKTYEKQRKLPRLLVEEIAKTRVLAHQSWVNAREQDQFSLFEGDLTRIVQLFIEKTEAIGFTSCCYDVLLDDFEPDAKTADISRVFSELKSDLVPLIRSISECTQKPNPEIIRRTYDISKQREVGIQAAQLIGFDLDSGRLDVTHHPFCCTLGPEDIRITTRYQERFFNSAFFGTLHEAGHGLYEQGLRREQFGLPAGEYCSLGIHESQSRLWENMVGRSRSFWEFFFPELQKRFGTVLSGVSSKEFFDAVNFVEPSLVRVEADEATYSLHVIIRFELEQLLFNGELQVSDLPEAWNQKYLDLLGLSAPNATLGVLQDVHWSEGLFGYFPTYALGNLYAAQFLDSARSQLGDLDTLFSRGEFEPLLTWLRTHVHQPGNSLSAKDILENATGQELSHQPMIDYLKTKYTSIYNL
ncbi:MAG: carboxypeptidase M32 [Planctomycetota bacterium]|nr:carboxypeptidase M32 [Planctomycetota bacterium]